MARNNFVLVPRDVRTRLHTWAAYEYIGAENAEYRVRQKLIELGVDLMIDAIPLYHYFDGIVESSSPYFPLLHQHRKVEIKSVWGPSIRFYFDELYHRGRLDQLSKLQRVDAVVLFVHRSVRHVEGHYTYNLWQCLANDIER